MPRPRTEESGGGFIFLIILVIGGAILWFGNDKTPPTPTPDDDVIVVPDGEKLPLRVLIVRETGESGLPVYTSVPFREAVKAAGGDLKVWDDETDLQFVDERWKKLMAMERKSLPWLIVHNGVKNFSGPLPTDSVESAIELVNKYK